MLTVSNNSLCQVSKCFAQAHLSFVLRLCVPEKDVKRLAGHAFHAAAEKIHSGHTVDEGLEALKTAYKPLTDPPDTYSLSNLERIFRTWARYHTPDVLAYKIIGVEEWFKVPLDDNGDFIFQGRKDFRTLDPSLNLVIPADLKTTGKVTQYTWEDYILNSQVSGYLYSEHLADNRVSQMLINVVEISLPPKPGRKCSIHKVDYSECAPEHVKWETAYAYRTEPQLTEWRKCAILFAKQLQTLKTSYNDVAAIPYVRQTGMFTSACIFCDFREFCRNDRPLHWIGSRLLPRADNYTE
jgi:hypothetical protein